MTLLKYNKDKFNRPYILMHIQFATAAIKPRQFASDIIYNQQVQIYILDNLSVVPYTISQRCLNNYTVEPIQFDSGHFLHRQ